MIPVLLALALTGSAVGDPGSATSNNQVDWENWIHVTTTTTRHCIMVGKPGHQTCEKPFPDQDWLQPPLSEVLKPQGCGGSSACGSNNFPLPPLDAFRVDSLGWAPHH
jgi:hypothetical protein